MQGLQAQLVTALGTVSAEEGVSVVEHRPQIADLESPDIHETGSRSGPFSDAKLTSSAGFLEVTCKLLRPYPLGDPSGAMD